MVENSRDDIIKIPYSVPEYVIKNGVTYLVTANGETPLKVFGKQLNKGVTTTLNVKKKLRKKFPNKLWFQEDVSETIINIYDLLIMAQNGSN